MSTRNGAVVIPAYGKVELTQATVEDCLREADEISVIVVDNEGSFPADARITVLRPKRNLGWLRGTNHGFEVARARGHEWLVALNNDTHLSAGFFRGLHDALEAHSDGLIAPCYDDHLRSQNSYFSGPVDEFMPEAVEETAAIIDGTCFGFTSDLFDRVGPMDASRFGRRGWGGIDDYILRVRALGGAAYVTRRAYLTHARGSTAHAVMSSYERYAAAEMRRGLRRKYGPNWRESLELDFEAPDSLRTQMSDFLRMIEDRFRLSETAVGRRS